MIYADVVIDISHEKLDRSFQYRVPEHLVSAVKVGMVVSIPFGNGNRERTGYVVGLSEIPKFPPEKIKEILNVRSGEETMESRLIALAAWMRDTYGSTMIQALKTVLPIKEKIKSKEKRFLYLQVSRQEGEALLEQLQGTRYKARARLLEALLKESPLDGARAAKELGATASVLDFFLKEGIIRQEQTEILRGNLCPGDILEDGPSVLNEEQQQAVQAVCREWEQDKPRPVLLHGVTGSGKTQVYMELIRRVLEEGKQAIVLIPEIALTYQTVRRFYGSFGEKVSVLNSRLSQGERYDQFKRARRGEIQIMVGPRSALFTPFNRLGLIIIDEEHEPTYKSENTPRYHARETAVQRAKMEGARVLLGSATPSVEAYQRALDGRYALVKLQSRFGDRPLPLVSVIDMREELRAGNRSMFSRELKEAMAQRLSQGEQTMLFLNRRGYAGFVSCRSCGHVMKCPHCDVSLSEHNHGRLLCHYCGYETVKPKGCPECGSPYIGGFKAGTQQIEQALLQLFPRARILRMDYDTTRTKGSYEQILSAFAAHKGDILIGTQMIVKGHDFPDVTLVGVIAADLSLNAEDYRCGERTFQLLTQAVGRSGRGKKPGQAMIQTYHPEHYSIQNAARQDYESFYEEEYSYRVLMDYPPAAHMMAVLGSCREEEQLSVAMHYIERFIRKIYPGRDLHVIGPAFETVGRVKDVYRMVLYLKHPDGGLLASIREKTEKYIEINSGFRKIYIQFDFS